MAKHVIIIASGETERLSLPHLLAHLQKADIVIDEVRIPAGNKALSVDMAERLVKAAWYANDPKPAKFVILVDADGKNPDDLLQPFQESLPRRLGPKITASIQFAFAQWHLEAWFFADANGLRSFLGGALGSIDTSRPDTISYPKQHLYNLLGGKDKYSRFVAEEIATKLDAEKIAGSSPSFKGFLEAVINGDSPPTNP